MTKDIKPSSLTDLEYCVLFEKGTEPAFSHPYYQQKYDGEYVCKNCSTPLFSSSCKYESGSGWPSFYDAYPKSIIQIEDHSHNMRRVEITCANCHCHLGHIFPDGPQPTGLRYCVNGTSLDFIKE